MSLTIHLGGERVDLLPGRAVFLPDLATLVVTDTHFGKDGTMRSGGLPIPEGVLESDLDRLDSLLLATAAERLVHLGDYFHAPDGVSDELLDTLWRWRMNWSAVDMHLILGNHDLATGVPSEEYGLTIEDPGWELGPWRCWHRPMSRRELGLAGHVHPGVVVRDRVDRLRLPCFYQDGGCLVLPAFSEFTGLFNVDADGSDARWAIADTAVVAV